jgi:hypothetical protein
LPKKEYEKECCSDDLPDLAAVNSVPLANKSLFYPIGEKSGLANATVAFTNRNCGREKSGSDDLERDAGSFSGVSQARFNQSSAIS